WGRPFSDTDCTRLYNDQLNGNALSPVPLPPSELRGSANGPGVNLTWQDNSSNETGFSIERSLDGASFSAQAVVPPNTNSYFDSSGLASTVYYRVAATHPAGNSDFSNVAVVGGNRPASPSALRVLG